ADAPRKLTRAMEPYVTVNAPVVAITHAKLIEGIGGSPKSDQRIIIRCAEIAAVGSAGSVQVPAGARVVDATGKTVIPGIVGLHDHMYYGGMKFIGTNLTPAFFLFAVWGRRARPRRAPRV